MIHPRPSLTIGQNAHRRRQILPKCNDLCQYVKWLKRTGPTIWRLGVRSQGTRRVVRIHVSARLDLHEGSLPLTRGHDDGGRTDRSAPRTDDYSDLDRLALQFGARGWARGVISRCGRARGSPHQAVAPGWIEAADEVLASLPSLARREARRESLGRR